MSAPMKTFAIICLALLAACSDRIEVDTPMTASHRGAAEIKPQGRFKVERVGVFADGLAYDNKRGIYVITDTTTGQEFVGISGVGISELGSHQSGKTSVSDER